MEQWMMLPHPTALQTHYAAFSFLNLPNQTKHVLEVAFFKDNFLLITKLTSFQTQTYLRIAYIPLTN
jgi:hypothetical protein